MQGCLFCGGDGSGPNHRRYCDGRQGAIEAEEPEPTPEPEPFALPTLAEAVALGAAGQEAVDAHADDLDFDRDGATVSILATLDRVGPQTGEQLVIAAKNDGFIPHDDRAFGSIFLNLARHGSIEKVGFRRRQRGHGADGAVLWALTKGIRS